MQKKTILFPSRKTDFYFSSNFLDINKITRSSATIFLTDENVFKFHSSKFKNQKTIVIKSGERFKTFKTISEVIEQLIALKADRSFTLVGVGGGVVTDIAGFVASIYMRGINFGFVPTTLLAMVDASIGGKNGTDIKQYKNMAGIFRQPNFILYDENFLSTLPHSEWQNGFAEIIKHALLKDKNLVKELENNSIEFYKKNISALKALIKKNVFIKTSVVKDDEFEKADRKLLNFGHTFGHAIENKFNISHGKAVAIGMVFAAKLSEKKCKFSDTNKIIQLLQQYELPHTIKYANENIFDLLSMDKKRISNDIQFVLLEKIGNAVVEKIKIDELKKIIAQIN